MITTPGDAEVCRHLRQRTGDHHVRRRLAQEAQHQAWSQLPKRFRVDRWLLSPAVIRTSLRLTLLYGRARRNALRLRLRRNEISLTGLPAVFDGYRILHISDPHFDMNPDFPAILADRIRDLDYDICVLTGDYRYLTHGPIEAALEGFALVSQHISKPVFGVLGNHDSIRMVPVMEALGARMLVNESVPLRRAGATLQLVGVDDPHYYRAARLGQACRDLTGDQPSILLVHSPEFYHTAVEAGFDLMLCGHTHGGQLCLPGGIPVIYDAPCPRHLASGAWRYRELTGYTSVGAGASLLDVRLNCLPEVTLHVLRAS